MLLFVLLCVSMAMSAFAMDYRSEIRDLRVTVHNSPVEIRDASGRTYLHRAVISGTVERVKRLIEDKADIEARDNLGHTPFFYACTLNKPDIVYLLRLEGANDPNPQQIELWDEACRAIGWADSVKKQLAAPILLLFRAWRQHRDDGSHIVTAIKGGVIDVNYQMQESPCWSVLHYAVQFDDIETMQFLVENGADVNRVDAFGHTPLHFAAEISLVSVMLLLRYGADVDACCNCGKTPLHHAVIKGKDACVQRLIDHKADVFVGDYQGSAPLQRAQPCCEIM